MAAATRERLIAAGLDLFARHGIAQVGLDRVLQQAELTKTTFYNHFDSKESLIHTVIERHQREVSDMLCEGTRRLGGGDPRLQLLAVFDLLDELHAQGKLLGSLLVNAIFDFPAPNDPTRLAALESMHALRDFFHGIVQAIEGVDVEEFTNKFVVLFNGVLLAYQMNRNPKAITAGRQMTKLLLDSATC